MAIGFNLDDFEKAYFRHKEGRDLDDLPPIGAPYHDEYKEKSWDDLPPIGAPFHD